MSTSRPIESASSVTISSTLPLDNPGKHDQVTGGAPCVVYEVTAVDTAPVVKVYVKSTASGSWRQWTAWQQAVDTRTRTQRTPGTSITLVAGDQIIVPAAGFYAVRLALQSGTSAALVARTSEEMGLMDILEALLNSASALDANIMKWNGDEYAIQRHVVGATGTSFTLAPNASGKLTVLLEADLMLGTGDATTFYINDGTDAIFGGSSYKAPMSADSSDGPPGFFWKGTLVTADVNRSVVLTTAGSVTLVGATRYIQVDP